MSVQWSYARSLIFHPESGAPPAMLEQALESIVGPYTTPLQLDRTPQEVAHQTLENIPPGFWSDTRRESEDLRLDDYWNLHLSRVTQKDGDHPETVYLLSDVGSREIPPRPLEKALGKTAEQFHIPRVITGVEVSVEITNPFKIVDLDLLHHGLCEFFGLDENKELRPHFSADPLMNGLFHYVYKGFLVSGSLEREKIEFKTDGKTITHLITPLRIKIDVNLPNDGTFSDEIREYQEFAQRIEAVLMAATVEARQVPWSKHEFYKVPVVGTLTIDGFSVSYDFSQ